MNTRLKRRTFLRGSLWGTVVGVGLPPLGAMLGTNETAFADGTPAPTRLVVFFFGSGVRLKTWVPQQTGTDWQLSPLMAPLQSVKRYVTAVSNVNVMTGSGTHSGGNAGVMSGQHYAGTANVRESRRFQLPSFDQIAAEHPSVGKKTRFSSIVAGVSRRVATSDGVCLLSCSQFGPNRPNHPEYDPAALFRRLFGGGLPKTDDPAAKAAFERQRQMRKSILDVVREDSQRLVGKLGGADKARLEQHLESVRSLESSVETAQAALAACKQPPAPRAVGGTIGDRDRSREPLDEVHTAMSQLLVTAMACDLTRVAVLQFTGPAGRTIIPVADTGKEIHGLTHTEGGDQPKVQRSVVYTMEKLAQFVKLMEQTPDAGGNLLDNSVVLNLSENAEGLSHSTRGIPVLAIGKAGGKLPHPGVHIRPSSPESISRVIFGALHAVGARVPSFGAGNGLATSPMPGLFRGLS